VKKFDIFGDVAAEMRGSATLAWVDCADKEGKKVHTFVYLLHVALSCI